MRKAYNNFGFLIHENKFVGVSLGYDHCAEHEWGVKGMKRKFGIPEPTKKNMGVKARTITQCDKDELVFRTEKDGYKEFAVLFTRNRYSEVANIPYDLKHYKTEIPHNVEWDEGRRPEDIRDQLITAWDENGFGIAVMGEKEISYLKELREAFLKKKIVIAFTSFPNNPFTGTSLCLMIKDCIPEEISNQMYSVDKEYYDREDYEEKIGMKKIIAEYGNKGGYKERGYFCACSPKWINYSDAEEREARKKEMNTEYDIMYWINYSDDDDNYGWYTVEQIREWLIGNRKLTEVAPKKKK